MKTMEPIVIIGSGLAGFQTAREIRRMDRDVPLIMICADSGAFYSKPMLSNAFASGKTLETLVIKTHVEMALELDARIRPFTRVDAIFPQTREIAIGSERIPYSKLVLALGADPIRIPISGDAEVLSINDIFDYGKFRAAVSGKKKVAILGAGLIGCEFANDLCAAGYEVDVFDIASQPLGRLVTPECGERIRRELELKGVTWHFDVKVESAVRRGGNTLIRLADGSEISSDVLLSAVGLKPRIALAQLAGIESNRGIATNRFLETRAQDIYAIGDCAEVEGLVLPFVMPIMHAARALAANLLGKMTPLSYPAMPVVVKTPACPVVVSPPKPGSDGNWHTESNAAGVKSIFLDEGGRMLGFALCGSAVSEKNMLAKALPGLLD